MYCHLPMEYWDRGFPSQSRHEYIFSLSFCDFVLCRHRRAMGLFSTQKSLMPIKDSERRKTRSLGTHLFIVARKKKKDTQCPRSSLIHILIYLRIKFLAKRRFTYVYLVTTLFILKIKSQISILGIPNRG